MSNSGAFSTFKMLYNDHLCLVPKHFHPPKAKPVPLPLTLHPPASRPCWPPSSFLSWGIHLTCMFPTNGAVHYVIIHARLPPLGTVLPRSVCYSVSVLHSFSCLNRYTTFCSPMHLSRSDITALVNHAMNISEQVPAWTPSPILWVYTLESKCWITWSLCMISSGTAKLFHTDGTCHYHTNNVQDLMTHGNCRLMSLMHTDGNILHKILAQQHIRRIRHHDWFVPAMQASTYKNPYNTPQKQNEGEKQDQLSWCIKRIWQSPTPFHDKNTQLWIEENDRNKTKAASEKPKLTYYMIKDWKTVLWDQEYGKDPTFPTFPTYT